MLKYFIYFPMRAKTLTKKVEKKLKAVKVFAIKKNNKTILIA